MCSFRTEAGLDDSPPTISFAIHGKQMNRSCGILLFVLLFSRAHGQDDRPFPSPARFLEGFSEEVSGATLSYWNFHTLARKSLLTRCTTGEMGIAWKTQSVPPSGKQDTLAFLWIGAFSTGISTADHDFDFYINDEKSLTFRTFKGGEYRNWRVVGKKGVVLHYKHVWIDHVNDAHGYFCLQVPASSYPEGQPLTLKVIGHKRGSNDWYMTFMYTVKESASVRSLPLLRREGEELRQPIEISVDSPSDRGTVTVSLDRGKRITQELRLGWNAVNLSVPAAEKESAVLLSVSINGKPPVERSVQVKPVQHRTLWLLPHSHNDIGYSHLQPAVYNIQVQNIRDALQLIEKSKDYPQGSRFKWNVEILWPVDSFLVQASVQEKEAFLWAVRNGDLGLNALYVNPLTGIARPEALIRLTDFAREIRQDYGIKIPVAMVSDIPGFSWGIVPALAQSGIRYFVSGPNSGDRIGHFTEAWGDKPFYWVGPSGKDTVLFWVAGSGYSMFHATRTFATNKVFLQKLEDYLEQLDATSYPYDIVQMRYSIYADNGMTDSTMSDYVRKWNEDYASPTLRIGTAEEMCVAFEQKYGSQIRSFAGEITPYWEDGAASTAAELGMSQRSTERLVQAEILTSMLEPKSFDRKAFSDAWDAVNLWIEHTWGAWNSVSDPDHPDAVAQWKFKQGYALQANDRSERLLNGRIRSGRNRNAMFEVINTSTWPRSDLVTLGPEESRSADRVVDENGKPVPSQRLTDGRLAFLARSVPGLGSSRFTVRKGPAGEPWRGVSVKGLELENEFLRLTIDSASGSIGSILDLGLSRELVGKYADGGLNRVVMVQGIDPDNRTNGLLTGLRVVERGPLVASIISESVAPGADKIVREVILTAELERVDVRNIVEKEPVREKEALYFGFGFNVPECITRLDVGWGFIRPERDQLPGSCKDFFSVARWVDLSNNHEGVTWASVEVPLVSLGGLVDERHHNEGPGGWKTQAASSSLLYSWVMNNYWHTNYKADQEGRSTYRYSLRPHSGFDAVRAYRFGVEINQPLLVRQVGPGAPRPSLPFRFASTAVTITTVTRAADGDALLVRLYNPSPQRFSCEIAASAPFVKLYESSVSGDKGVEIRGGFEMGPFEIRTVRCEMSR